MSEKNRSLFYLIGIILLFALLVLIIWLVYDYQMHRLDKSITRTSFSYLSINQYQNCQPL